MKGEGAIVFLIVFIVLLAATLAASSLPPGRDLYGLLGVPETNYPVLGVPTTRALCLQYSMESSMELSFGSYSHSSEGQQRNKNSKLNVIQKKAPIKKFIQKAKNLQLEVKT